ncbi:MAG TPA: protein kinase, partial [Candidatus Nanopelagicales bacterium]|nr:protein kinase [Candidatus Nanopelagicales bacterium]
SGIGGVETGVARLVDADDAADRPWLAWEYIPGPSLQTRAAGAPLAPDQVDVVARELATALAQLHAAGYAHCDVKPANVVLGPDGLRLVDLGLVHGIREGAPEVAMGSPGWSPPEQGSPDRDGRAVDVHGWGMCVAFAATGRNAFGVDPTSGDPDRMRSGQPRLAGLDEPLRSLVAAALAADPAGRPSMDDIVDRLRAWELGSAATSARAATAAAPTILATETQAFVAPTMIEPTTGDPVTSTASRDRWRRALPAAAVAGVALLLSSWWFLHPLGQDGSGASAAPRTTSSPSAVSARATPTGVVVPVVATAAPSKAAPVQPAKPKPTPHGKGKGKHRR